MADVPSQVFYPSGYQQLFAAWSRFPDAVPFAGGTALLRFQARRIINLPRNIICLDRLEEMSRVTRTERYLEIGAMVTLNEITALGKAIPEALSRTIAGISGPQTRNIATIGGNICFSAFKLDLATPLNALDAHYELRTALGARWVSASRFTSLATQELLTRIRIPLEQWDYTVFRKFAGGTMALIAKTQKNILTEVRLVFNTGVILRDRNIEAFLIGKQLPMSRKDALEASARWKNYLQGMKETDPLTQARIYNLVKANILTLAE